MYMSIYFNYTSSCALGFIDLSTSILIDRSNYTMCCPTVHGKWEIRVNREDRNLLVVFIFLVV